MTDQLTATVLNLYGGKGVPTPNLDALAARGVTFDNMISTGAEKESTFIFHISELLGLWATPLLFLAINAT